MRSDFVSAAKLYKQALVSGENPALCYFNLGNAFFQLDSIPQSIVNYRSSLVYAPEFFKGYLNLAVAYYSLEDVGACISVLYQALTLQPQDKKARLILAASYRKAGDVPLAIVTFERLCSDAPDMEEPYIALGEMYRDLEDRQEAISWLSRYPDAGKNRAYVDLLLADLYEKEDDLGRALYFLNASFERDPKNKWVYYRIEQMQEKMGTELVALETARRGMELFPAFGDLALAAGNLAFRFDKYEEAEHWYMVAKNSGNAGGVIGLENVRQARMALAAGVGFEK
jgi:tetratricopeptide (TPR) repeat protein